MPDAIAEMEKQTEENEFFDGEDEAPEKLEVEFPDDEESEDNKDTEANEASSDTPPPNVNEEGADDGESDSTEEQDEQPPALSPGLSNLAKTRFGMNDEEIAAFKDDDELVKAMNVIPNRDESGKEEQEESKDDEGGQENLEALIKKMEGDDWDEDLVGILKKQHESFKSQAEQIQSLQSQLEGATVNQFERWVDGKFSEFEDTHGDLLGKGEINNVSQEEYGRRVDVIEMMNSIAETKNKQGVDPLNDDELFTRALNAVHPERVSEIAGKKVTDKLRGKGNFTNRASRRDLEVEAKTPEQEAEEAIKSYLREHGFDEDGDSIDGIPE